MTTSEYKPTKEEKLFQKYYDKLIWETLFARAHLKLWKQLEGFKSTHLNELNQAPYFFTFTAKAHFDDSLMTLSRILDVSKGDPLSIWKFLNFVEQHQEMFSTSAFRQRMKSNSNFDGYWVESHISITLEVIQQHRQKLRGLAETIGNVKRWRDKVIAHTDRKFYLQGKIVSKEHPLKAQRLQEVADTLFEILNTYSAAYNSSTFHNEFARENDIRDVMDSLRLRIQEKNNHLQAEMEALRRRAHNKG